MHRSAPNSGSRGDKHQRWRRTRTADRAALTRGLVRVVQGLAVGCALVSALLIIDFVLPPKAYVGKAYALTRQGSDRTAHLAYPKGSPCVTLPEGQSLDTFESPCPSFVPVSQGLYERATPGDFLRVERTRLFGEPRQVERIDRATEKPLDGEPASHWPLFAFYLLSTLSVASVGLLPLLSLTDDFARDWEIKGREAPHDTEVRERTATITVSPFMRAALIFAFEFGFIGYHLLKLM